MKNKIWLILDSLCGVYWIYAIYNSIITNNITDLRGYAIGGSIMGVLMFVGLIMNIVKERK